MVIHANDDRSKKVISMHICTEMVCKNCINYSKSTLFPNSGRCHELNRSGLRYNDFCSLFKKRIIK